ERPYTCEVCNKGFTRKDNFKDHLAIHLKEKPYACEVSLAVFCHSLFGSPAPVPYCYLLHFSYKNASTKITHSSDISDEKKESAFMSFTFCCSMKRKSSRL
ncbi:unnamed protein product, partial [Larinioides sclopetarius]